MRSCTPHVMALPASTHAGAELGAAAREVVDAVDEHQTFVREATSAHTEADDITRQADS